MNKKCNTIIISNILSTIITSRDAVNLLKKRIISLNSCVNLDFSDIEFVSRSAAHALILLKEDFLNEKTDIFFLNTNDEVKKMIRIVAANRVVPKDKPDFNPEEASFNDFLKEISV